MLNTVIRQMLCKTIFQNLIYVIVNCGKKRKGLAVAKPQHAIEKMFLINRIEMTKCEEDCHLSLPALPVGRSKRRR